MRAYDIIKKKRDGAELLKEELSFLITEYLSNKIPDYQMSAFLMAVYFSGMTDAETIALTELMLSSGNRLDFSDISIPKVDKHSTGGVGDKTSIILAPLMAAMNVKVPMIAGRGLGHTGGTIDKLESIPGFRTDLSVKEFKDNIRDIGFSIMSQTDEIAPADKKLYSLRDVTATVESIPLIAASIMSKKLAEGHWRACAGRQSRQRRIHEKYQGCRKTRKDHGQHRQCDGSKDNRGSYGHESASRENHWERS